MKRPQSLTFIALACVLAAWTTGCVLPRSDKVTSGHRYSDDALTFLDLPNTTCDEVIASLGPPMFESHEPRVLMYHWETMGRFRNFWPERERAHRSTVYGNPKQWVLLVTFTRSDQVWAHEIVTKREYPTEETCLDWGRQKSLK